MDATRIQIGMSVIGADGSQIGSVTQVYRPSDALPIDDTTALTGEGQSGGWGQAVTLDPAGGRDPGLADMVGGYGEGAVDGDPIAARSVADEQGDGQNAESAPTQEGIVEMGSGRRSSSGVDTNPAANATRTGSMAETGYFVIDYGGFLGLGEKELFIPFDAIETIDDTRGIVLTCTRAEADRRFQARPPFMT